MPSASNEALNALLNRVREGKIAHSSSGKGTGQNGNGRDTSTALAAASQYIVNDLRNGYLQAGGPSATVGESSASSSVSSSEEAIAHALNRLLVTGIILPLIDSPEQDSQHSVTGLGVQQVLETLSKTLSSSPKFLEHVFESSDDSSPDHAVTPFCDTTFDVWVAPRLLCASASVLVAAHHQIDSEKRGHLLRLSRELRQQLHDLLSASIDSVAQLDNVRLILIECLRTSVHALSQTGLTSFTPDVHLPDYLVPQLARSAPGGAPNDSLCKVAFFNANSSLVPFRLTSRKNRPKPSGKGLAAFSSAQSDTRFEYSLRSPDIPSGSTTDRAQALFLTTIDLCLSLASEHATILADIAEDAFLTFANNLQHAWTLHKLNSLFPTLELRFGSYRFDIVARGVVHFARSHLSTLLGLLQISTEQSLHLVEADLDDMASDVILHGTMETFTSLSHLWQCCAAGIPVEDWPAVSSLLRPCVALLVDELRCPGSPHLAIHDLQWTKARCVVAALSFAFESGPRMVTESISSRISSELDKLSNHVQTIISSSSDSASERVTQARNDIKLLNRLRELIRLEPPFPSPAWTWRKTLKRSHSRTKVETPVFETIHHETRQPIDHLHDDLQHPPTTGSEGGDSSSRSFAEEVSLRKRTFSICRHCGPFSASSTSTGANGLCFCHCDNEVQQEYHRYGFQGAEPRELARSVLTDLQTITGRPFSFQYHILDSLLRLLLHTPIEERDFPEGGDDQLVQLIGTALKSKARRIRLLANRLAFASQKRFADQRGILPEDASEKRLGMLPQVYSDILSEAPLAKCHETAIIGLARLCCLPVEACQESCLLTLILQLGNANPFLKSCAYAQIVQLASEQKCTTFQLIRTHLEKISTTIVERFISMPDLWTQFLSLIKMNQAAFFNSTIQYTLPHLITMICTGQGDTATKMIELIARALGTDVPQLCLLNMTPIFRAFFMRSAAVRVRGLNTLVELIGSNAANLKNLLRSRQSDIVGYLVSKLGSKATRKEAYEGLEFIIETIQSSDASSSKPKEAHSRKAKVATFLKGEILAILTWTNQELSGEHGRRTNTERAHVIRSIGALVEIIGPPISAVTPQIMATLNSHLQPEALTLSTLESWRIFITTMRFDDIGPFVGQTAAALLAAWSHFNPEHKDAAISILHYLILENAEYLKAFIDDIPSLDRLDAEIPDICRALRGMRDTWNNDELFRNILDRAAHENSSICHESLKELRTFLSEERGYVEGLTSGDSFSPLIGQCVRTLMRVMARSDAQQTDIRDLSFRCFGLIGAVDPDRIEHTVEEPLKIVLNNFDDQDEAIEFALHLVQDLLVPAFRAADDTTHQSGLAYAIQELLKFSGLTSTVLSTGPRPVSIKARQRLAEMPQDVVDTIAPLLDSKYMAQVGKTTVKETPIYKHTQSYRDWLQSWANRLITRTIEREKAQPTDIGVNRSLETAATIFGVFRIAIRDQDIGVARHLLPHLVLHAIISGDTQDREAIVDEVQIILRDQLELGIVPEGERRLLTAQTLFQVMDHIGVWMRRKRQDLSKSSRRPRNALGGEDALTEVELVMKRISQELLAQASLQCKAYSRALLNFELRVRSMRNEGKKDSDLQHYYESMHRIYAQLDEPDGMEGISALVVSPTLEHQIREHESTGRWTSAQSCWEVELQKRPDDPELHLGLLRCLRNLGHYDTMRTHIRGALSSHPEWEDLLDAYRVEGACILGDWKEVSERTSRTQATSPEHSVGRALLSMRGNNDAAFQQALTQARQDMGKPLIASGKTSYPSIYDAVLNLHMLHELEMIRSHAAGRVGVMTRSSASDLNRSLAARLNATLPSFRTQEPLLSLRRTAFSALPSLPAPGTEVGEAWISTAKIARRAGHTQTAYSATLQATQHQAPFAFVQRVKLLAREEQTHAAIQDLSNSLTTLVSTFKPGQTGDPNNELPIELQQTDLTGVNVQIERASFAKACLLRARLLDSTFRYTATEILDKYKEAAKEQANSEKMWYYLGHFQDTHEGLLPNVTMQRFNVCRSFLRSALLGTKFFYRTLPRILTIWMDMAADDQIMSALRKGPGGDSEVAQKLEAFKLLNTLMKKSSKRLKPFQWLAVFPQLVARIVQKNEEAWHVLQDIILQVLLAYPQQAMWSMVAGSNSKDSERRRRYGEITSRLTGGKNGLNAGQGQTKEVVKIVTASQRLARELLRLCDYSVGKSETTLSMERHFPGLLEIANTSDLLLPLQTSMTVLLPANHLISEAHRAFPSNLPTIRTFEDHIEVMNSLQKPRKVMIVGSDGNRYPFLCKPKDDLRKDARLMEFDSMINKILLSQPESRKRKLYVRTYAVLILNEEHGLIEWVPNTVGFRHILTKFYSAKNMHIYNGEVKTNMDEARLSPDPKTTEKIFQEKVLAKFPPVFHEWFLATFPDPTAWLKARSAYARTAAVMSMVGFVLGLGDRHGENILFDSVSGDTVHVDLNCLFDKGQRFEIPERVPFRLTQNMVDAMGVTGCDGVFRKSAEITMGILRDNKDSLMSVLEAMVHDPLGEWSVPDDRHRSRHSSNRQDPRVVEARRALDPVANKLDGRIYRLGVREPTPPYSTNNLVDALIKEATSSINLAKMYIGWSSWL